LQDDVSTLHTAEVVFRWRRRQGDGKMHLVDLGYGAISVMMFDILIPRLLRQACIWIGDTSMLCIPGNDG